MKIAYVIGKCCPGGVVSYACEYSKQLLGHGHSVDIYVHESDNEKWLTYVEERSSRVVQIPSIMHVGKYVSKLKESLREREYDIVHGFMNTLNFPSMVAAKDADIGIRIAENLSTGSRLEPKSLVKQALKPLGKMGATAIAANSKLAAQWLYGKDVLDECFIIPNPIDPKQFYYDADLRLRSRSSLGISDGFAIGCVARFERQKNLPFLIDVFKEVSRLNPNALLFLVGHGNKEGELRQLSQDEGLEGKIRFLDPDTDRNALYNALDVFVLPSLYEGMPIVALEAEFTGLQCVLSDEITRECNIGDMCTFLGLSESAKKWAQVAVSLSEQKARLDDSSIAQMSIYDSNVAAKKLELLYESLVVASGR